MIQASSIQGSPIASVFGRNFSLRVLAVSMAKVSLVVLFVIMLMSALVPDIRSALRTTMIVDFRTVVSTAHGDLLGIGRDLTVAKVRTRDSLFIEVYEPRENGGQRLVERIELEDKKDGYFNFNGRATNLAIDDIDGDGRLEILAPSFDQNLVGHLNVFSYNQGTGLFQLSLR